MTPEQLHVIKMTDLFAMKIYDPRQCYNVLKMVSDNDTYRLAITKKGKVEVMCFGFTSVDRELKPSYNSVDDLPNWVKERLAVLSIIDPTPPTPEVEGVGRRISKNVFWVYHPDWRPI
jgi:hypothetical protein